jgi:protein O-GlcNAc transferase
MSNANVLDWVLVYLPWRVCYSDAMNVSLKVQIQQAYTYAQAARRREMLAVCQQITETHSDDVDALLDIGVLFLNFGYIARARECFERVQSLVPSDLRPVVNMANLSRDAGDHADARRLYAALQSAMPNHPVIRRNFLVSQEYDPFVADHERLHHARAWGEWAIDQAGGRHTRPQLSALAGRRLRIGYLSADFCQHTVGLFLKEILSAHNATQLAVHTYSAGKVSDWVTDAIRRCTRFRDVADIPDTELVRLIRQDEIDVLIDLSGHTAGSRLTVFAHRPAPVQVSWLGYFATTGLSCMDAVLLDEWHAPIAAEACFVEPVIRLPGGRFCYQPVPWASGEVSVLPGGKTGQITFGSFNNTAKYNDGVFDIWARILAAVPHSRLVLKWRTLVDEQLCGELRQAFVQRGIDPLRLELRPASFHVDVLREYADIDIALDPFPFTGGITSCEALWMGVPVVTWPQSRVVSRQTFAFLSVIGLPELVAEDGDDYVRKAVNLASDHERLATMRKKSIPWTRKKFSM